MTSGYDPVAREAELARFPGPKLVHLLRTRHFQVDFQVVARVLDERDRRLEAVLADNDALRRKCDALLDAQRRPRNEAEEMPHLGIAQSPAPAPAAATMRRDDQGVGESEEWEVKGANFIDLCSSDDEAAEAEVGRDAGSGVPIKIEAYEHLFVLDSEEDGVDTVPLRQRWKRRRQGEPRAVESGNVDDPQKCSPVRTDAPEARAGQMVDSPEDSKVAPFVQRRGTVQPEKGQDGEMPRTVPHSPGHVVKTALQKLSSKSDNEVSSPAVPGDRMSSPERNASPTLKKCMESMEPNDESRNALADSAPDGAGSMLLKGEQEKGTGVVQMAKVLQGTSGIGEQGGNLDSTPTKVGESNQRDEELQNKSVSSSSKSTSIEAKGRKGLLPSAVTRRWESYEHLSASVVASLELCMQALCALYRQRKLVLESNGGGQTGTIGLSEIDTCRAIKLATFLLDGDLQGPVKRTVEEVLRHDVAWSILLRRVVFSCSKVLFDIYRNKEDPYFS
ncbi:hypothetical protein ABZP36_014846 [Zizania latifolia]